MTEIPRKAVQRTAKLASLPLGVAGRVVGGWGKRLTGRAADEVFDRLKAKYLAMAQKQDGGDSADATRHIVKPG